MSLWGPGYFSSRVVTAYGPSPLWNASSLRVRNVGSPKSESDATTKKYVDRFTETDIYHGTNLINSRRTVLNLDSIRTLKLTKTGPDNSIICSRSGTFQITVVGKRDISNRLFRMLLNVSTARWGISHRRIHKVGTNKLEFDFTTIIAVNTNDVLNVVVQIPFNTELGSWNIELTLAIKEI